MTSSRVSDQSSLTSYFSSSAITSLTNKIGEESYNGALTYCYEGLKIATVGLGFTAGGGFNPLVCLGALLMGGFGGAIYGAVYGTVHALSSKNKNVPVSQNKNESRPNNSVINFSIFSRFFQKTIQTGAAKSSCSMRR